MNKENDAKMTQIQQSSAQITDAIVRIRELIEAGQNIMSRVCHAEPSDKMPVADRKSPENLTEMLGVIANEAGVTVNKMQALIDRMDKTF